MWSDLDLHHLLHNTFILPKRQILDISKLKDFADHNFKFDENGRKFPKNNRKRCGKRICS